MTVLSEDPALHWSSLPSIRLSWTLVVRLALVLTLLGALVAHVVTYDDWADGPWREYSLGTAVSYSLALITWLVARIQVPSGALATVLPWLAMAGILVPNEAVHYVRIKHPLTGTRAHVVETNFSASSGQFPSAQWLTDANGGGDVRAEAEHVLVTAPSGSRAFLDMRQPQIQDVAVAYWLPRGLSRSWSSESVEWDVSVARTGTFLVLLDTGTCLIQSTEYGLLVSYRDERGETSEQQLEAPQVNDGRPHRFLVERNDGLIRLRIDDIPLWVAPKPRQWSFVRLGETRSGVEHSGTLRVSQVRYQRRYAATEAA